MTGTLSLVRLALRRDRVIMPLWVVLIAVVPVSYVTSIGDLYPTDAARAQFAATTGNSAAFVTLYGRLYGSSLGELVTWRGGFIPVMVGLISLLTVIRHTRTDEEAGRRELVGATVVGRHATLAAALVATVLANLALGGLSALILTSQGLEAHGSLAYGAQLISAGLVFAAVGAVAAQLTTGAGSARGIGISVLGAAYLVRVVGDLGAMAGGDLSWFTWVSPLGWVTEMRPFGQERWWIPTLAVGVALALMVVAVALSARRDVGAGLLPSRLGPASAGPLLRSPLALAWRLHRGLLLAWAAGFAALGLVFGSITRSVGDMLGDNAALQEVFVRMGGTQGLIDAYLSAIMGILGLIASAYAIQAALKLRAEEASLRAEPLLATRVGRLRWAGSHLFFALLGPATVLAVAGVTTGLTHGLNTGDVGRELPRVLGATLAQLPAVWTLAAVAIALFGLLPRLAVLAWAALALCLLITLIGPILQLDQVFLDVSPFTHIPKVPAAALTATPLLWLTAVAAALLATGLAGLRRRDIPVP